ncbi:unnamed protein product (mitochondrion) [Musa banksii]
MISFSFSVLVIFVSYLLYLVIPGDDEDLDISFYMNTTATHTGVLRQIHSTEGKRWD